MLKPSEQRLRKLDRFLTRPDLGDDVMLLSEFDGFVAGVAVCPDLIMPSEWLAEVWGEDGPVFDSERQANEIIQLIMAHYNDILRRLGRPGAYAPLLDEDTDGTLLWEMWAVGFGRAIALRPEAWAEYTFAEDPAVRRALVGFRKLEELANKPGGPSGDIEMALDACAPNIIAEGLEILHSARLAYHASVAVREPAAKTVGRNDPCPCGSGKKFKKCCLN
jgi:uncharacterized protein